MGGGNFPILSHVPDEDERELQPFGLVHSHDRHHPGRADLVFVLFLV
jgi:hypothetical protein